jgi:hypothetical protein
MEDRFKGITEGDWCAGDDFFDNRTGDFSIGQSYVEEPAYTIICKKCGSDKFIVGRSDYYTAIKCGKCKYELCIHQG